MLVSSADDRERGYGLPKTEYRELYNRRETMEPLPATQVWIGIHDGQRRLESTWVTPLVVDVEGVQEPDWPQAYAMTVVIGRLVLQGVRFTAPLMELDLSDQRGFPQLWPTDARIEWPTGVPVNDEDFIRFSGGRELRVTEPHIELRPWRPATELPESRMIGAMVEMSAICGEHDIYYPGVLVEEAILGRFYAFVASCECKRTYLIQTEADGAHCKAAGNAEVISELYEALYGEEHIIEDEGGGFVCKRLSD